MSRREMLRLGTRGFLGATLAPAAASAQDWWLGRTDGTGKARRSARAPVPKPESLAQRSERILHKSDMVLRDAYLQLGSMNDVPWIKATMEREFMWLDRQELDIARMYSAI